MGEACASVLINDLTVLRSYHLIPSLYIRYNLVPVTRIAFWQSKGDWWNKNFLAGTHRYDAARDWRSNEVRS